MDSAETRPATTPYIQAGLGLLIFFQYNDALLEFVKPLPLISLISASTALTILFSISPFGLKQRVIGAWLIFVPIVALISLSAFSSFYAWDPDKALEDTVRMLKISFMVLIMAYAVRSTRDLMKAMHAFIFASIVLGGFVILEAIYGQPFLQVERHEETLDLYNGFFRSSGLSMESPPMAATMTLCGASLSAVMFLRRRSSRAFCAIGFLVSSVAVVISLTRSATISLVVILVILIWRLRCRHGFYWIVAATVALFLMSMMLMPPEVWAKLRVVFDPESDQTILRRLGYQIIGWDLFVSNPVFGVGAGNFNEHYASAEYRFVPGRGTEPRPLHNLYLQYLSELGILGFALLAGMIGAVVRSLGKVIESSGDSDLKVLADALLIGFLSCLFQLFFISSNFLFPFWAIIGLTAGVLHLGQRKANGNPHGPARQLTVASDAPVTSE